MKALLEPSGNLRWAQGFQDRLLDLLVPQAVNERVQHRAHRRVEHRHHPVGLRGLARVVPQVHEDERPKEERHSGEVGGAGGEGLGAAPGGAHPHDSQDNEQIGNRDDQDTSGHNQNGERNDHHLLGVAVPTREL